MTSPEDHDRKMRIIQEQIDEAHKRVQRHAENMLKAISDNYQNRLLEKIAEELKLAQQALQHGDEMEANQHRIRADVYESALNAMKR